MMGLHKVNYILLDTCSLGLQIFVQEVLSKCQVPQQHVRDMTFQVSLKYVLSFTKAGAFWKYFSLVAKKEICLKEAIKLLALHVVLK